MEIEPPFMPSTGTSKPRPAAAWRSRQHHGVRLAPSSRNGVNFLPIFEVERRGLRFVDARVPRFRRDSPAAEPAVSVRARQSRIAGRGIPRFRSWQILAQLPPCGLHVLLSSAFMGLPWPRNMAGSIPAFYRCYIQVSYMAFTLPEKILLALCICASLAGFWVRFRYVVEILRAAKPDADFSIGSLPRRFRRFVSEVLFQSKVIAQRPIAGVAHAFVFWGFCAFILISINHIATGFGLPVLPRDSTFGRIYYAFVALFAVMVAISIVWLTVRRFVVRPVWLGKVNPESGIIAGLIFILMITYLAALNRSDDHALWWIHTLALLAFLPIIPHTKHLHLLLSPATVFLKRPGFSDIPKLSGDEDFGLVTGKDVTKIDALQALSCVECGRCTEHCPAFNTGKSLNPKEVILGLRAYLTTEGPASERPLLGTHISEEAVFQCTTCGGCEFQCPVGIQHLPLIIGMRRGAVNTGTWGDSFGTKLFLTMERNGNALGIATGERQKFIDKNALPIYDGTQEYCLWLGCMGAYDPVGRETILALVQILDHLGITFGVLKKEKCNGDPARRLGNDLLFTTLAEENMGAIENSKAGKFLSICPHCVRTMGTDWSEAGQTVEIEHHTELLARHKMRLPILTGEGREKVVYHDPCYLGRYRGVYDEPREVLSRGVDLTEAPRHRERSFCCGAGGGQMFLGEEKGKRVNIARAEELVATGADTVVTGCPFCSSMFRDALKTVTEQPPKLLDIAQIVARGLGAG
jgi:Fe-S oxidoreductase